MLCEGAPRRRAKVKFIPKCADFGRRASFSIFIGDSRFGAALGVGTTLTRTEVDSVVWHVSAGGAMNDEVLRAFSKFCRLTLMQRRRLSLLSAHCPTRGCWTDGQALVGRCRVICQGTLFVDCVVAESCSWYPTVRARGKMISLTPSVSHSQTHIHDLREDAATVHNLHWFLIPLAALADGYRRDSEGSCQRRKRTSTTMSFVVTLVVLLQGLPLSDVLRATI